MVMPLDSPQPNLAIPSLADVQDSLEDKPVPGLALDPSGPLSLPPLVYGAGSFSNQYNADSHIISDLPLRTIRLALRYGINTFDTSAYYGPSEIVLGNALKALESEFPRSSYKLMTKCGRYGAKKAAFDYRPSTIRRSVERSLQRLHTDYLDVVFLHDVEFIAPPVQPRSDGSPLSALDSEASEFGLAVGQEGKIWGDGDQQILDAYSELLKLKEEGVVKHIGITGYPLSTLLRLALLILHNPPYKPIDILLSYSHSNLQNTAFTAFAPHLLKRAQTKQLVAASPLNMGLLTPSPPGWHPAPPKLRGVVARARDACAAWPGGLPNVALGFSMREGSVDSNGGASSNTTFPVVVGFSKPAEVHEAVKVWRAVQNDEDSVRRREIEHTALELFKESGYYGWSWASPGADA